jgi:uncharacterized protein YbjT (DUF2867 family)
MSYTILVTGATGKQGGGVVKALLASKEDVRIYALTRNPSSPSAVALGAQSESIKVITGNLDSPEEIFANIAEPVWGVFSMQNPIGGGASAVSEERQGKALVDAAIKYDVKHFVYTSGDRGGKEVSDVTPTDVPTFAAKYRIEKYLQEKAAAVPGNTMTWTILRPTCFMENFLPGFFGKVMSAICRVAVPADKKIQFISSKDIGYFGAQAFLQHDSADFKNVSISLASEAMTLAEVNALCQEKTGKPLPTTFDFMAKGVLRIVKELRLMFLWIGLAGGAADIQECKRLHPGMTTMGDWLQQNLKQ